jgi:hypothetical protein
MWPGFTVLHRSKTVFDGQRGSPRGRQTTNKRFQVVVAKLMANQTRNRGQVMPGVDAPEAFAVPICLAGAAITWLKLGFY